VKFLNFYIGKISEDFKRLIMGTKRTPRLGQKAQGLKGGNK